MDLITQEEAEKLARAPSPEDGPDPNDNSSPVFYYRAVHRPMKSEAAGREIYEDVEYVEILLPGVMGEKPDRKVTAEDMRRWPAQYAAFLAKEEQPLTGTPIEACAIIGKSWAAQLKAKNIKTVEGFLGVPDQALATLGPESSALQDKVRKWADTSAHAEVLETKATDLEGQLSASGADLQRAATENGQLKNEVRELEEKCANLKKENEEIREAGSGGAGVDLTPLQSALVDKGWPIGDLDGAGVRDMAVRALKKAQKKDLDAIKGEGESQAA